MNFFQSVDQLIVMSVVPGKSGQQYIEETHAKMSALKPILEHMVFQAILRLMVV